jgi:type IV pilus assembly protein PilX
MNTQSLQRQSGTALIVALTILLVLTVLGVSAMRTTSLQDKMAGNARDSQVAFEAAEFALRQAEQALANDTVVEADFANDGGTGAYFSYKGLNPEAWTVEANWTTKAVPANTYTGNVSKFPVYMIQKVDANINVEDLPVLGGGYGSDRYAGLLIYQITARGFGISPNSRVMLQSYYRE